MKYYKNNKNDVYAYALDGSQDAYIQKNLVQITETEANALRAPSALLIKEAANNFIKSNLFAIDMDSVRTIREYIASKIDAPQTLKDKEAAAIIERAKLTN